MDLHDEHRLFRGALSPHRPLEPCPGILLLLIPRRACRRRMRAIECLCELCKFCVETRACECCCQLLGDPFVAKVCAPLCDCLGPYVARLCAPLATLLPALATMITRAVLLFSTVRQYLLRQLKTRAPLVTASLYAVPVKTLAFLNGAGVVSVIFASVQKVQLDTFGAACGALACLLLTLSMRIATDEKMTETFGAIMTGTLRQKTRALHDGLLYGAAGLASIGFAVMGAERVAEHVSDVAPPLDSTDIICLLALGALALQVLCASPFDADDPAHLAFAVFAHDWSALAQAVAVSTRGARSFASASVVVCLAVAHVANAAQLDAARRETTGEEAPPDTPKMPPPADPGDGVERAYV